MTLPRDRAAVARRRRAALGALLVVLAAVAFAALREVRRGKAQESAASLRPAATDATIRAGVERCVFVDASRSTEDYVTGRSTPGRRLVTDIFYPTFARARAARRAGPGAPAGALAVPGAVQGATPAYGRGPFPAVFFLGGYGLDPPRYAKLLERWVASGLVVVAPEPPDASAAAYAAVHGSSADEADIPNEPGDITFVTRRVLGDVAATGHGCPVLRGLIDPNELGLAGQSDGGTAVGMLAFDQGDVPGTATSYRSLAGGLDYRAVAIMSGQAWGNDPYAASASSPPLLAVQSATDECNPPQESVDLYSALAEPRRWFLAIRRADHLTPYEGQDVPAFDVVARVTTAFFAAALGGRPVQQALSAVDVPASVGALASGAHLPSWMDVSTAEKASACYKT